MTYTIMTLMFLHMNMFPVMQQITTTKPVCEYIKFEAEHNYKGLMVKCDHYTKL